jgi:hypothetical protein
MRMMAKDPDQRYPDAGQAVRAYCEVVVPIAEGKPAQSDKPVKKSPLHTYHVKPGLSKFDLTTGDVRSATDDLRARIAARQKH